MNREDFEVITTYDGFFTTVEIVEISTGGTSWLVVEPCDQLEAIEQLFYEWERIPFDSQVYRDDWSGHK